ncbi:ORF6N domain [Serratia ficaria]|uniref:ORF6N domain-containing protein n=1 Tax=Serratia ficaria TaxID=61651 RepID=UPI002179025E|nr:ORF6N domain-containing protein [Serratia ficaria]CAI1174851.1 ORF6N domain [Serratia ficaria]CAI1981548.1 ORF6N domain [Serratia ficaria]CAI2518926.1 ORF6N domain [Serratia ficaria]CAI2793415.1 ORF6N domain [Serratia ficaria]
MNTITIQNAQLPVIEYQSERVVTLAMVDAVHQRPDGTARRNFNEHRNRFIENEDFFVICADEIRMRNICPISPKAQGDVIFLTQQGYLMVTKPFKDDLAWQVQRQLVNGYFRQRQQQPKTQNEIIAAMALANVEQERRLNHVEDQVVAVTETIEQIKRGTIPAGWAGYSLLRTKSGLTDTKCRTLVKGYNIPTDTITIMTPDGQPRPMKIVLESAFMSTFRQMMTEAEPRGVRWYHPQMGLFQVIGWESGSCR